MAERQNTEELIEKICHLYCLSQFREARTIIYDAAGISPEVRSFSRLEEINKYISDHHPDLKILAVADKAFTEMGNMFQNAASITADDVHENIKSFENILPYMQSSDVLRVRYWHTRLYSYPDLKDEQPRLEALAELIECCPPDCKEVNAIMEDSVRQINYLNVSPLDKYKIIKKAQAKSSPDVRGKYAPILAPLADAYFDKMLELAADGQATYDVRQQYYHQALDSIKDIDISQDAKMANAGMPEKISMLRQNTQHKRKLLVLGRLKKLHKLNNHPDRAAQVRQKMNNLCFAFYKKFPQLRAKKDFTL